MQVSFLIITNGKKPRGLELQIKSILLQQIPNFEILIVGNCDQALLQYPSIIYFPAEELALQKLLGALRNKGCRQATYDNIVISDDDMLFSKGWYQRLKKNKNFKILTPKVRLPDGGRFWDHACYLSPNKGHQILEPSEKDDHLYMSGGQSWVMKKGVFEKVKWGEQFDMAGGEHSMSNVEDYHAGKHNEDTDFSEKCRAAGFCIQHDHQLEVWHNDDSYTTVGRYTRRRQNGRTSSWLNNSDFAFPPLSLARMAQSLFETGFEAEGIDFARHALSLNFKNPELEGVVNEMNLINGGKLSDADFTSGTCDEYKELINLLD